ncbi:hypothetical protein G2W53_037197 [Senna tora]|uniref:Uncharacterized protein n=1 Tax=Senna tora TaxID=362788 RepID=A0A834WAX0_9FABA|nr:hypothetical protein G2W53_037197 [Senna tora]
MRWMKKFVMKKNILWGTHVTEDSSSTQVLDTSEVQPTNGDQEVSFEDNDDHDQEDPILEEENDSSNSTRTRWLLEVIGIIGRNFRWLPLSYKSWRDVPKDYKNEVYQNQIQAKFVVNDDAHKHNILQFVSKTWKDE